VRGLAAKKEQQRRQKDIFHHIFIANIIFGLIKNMQYPISINLYYTLIILYLKNDM